MTKDKVQDWDATAANNTDISGINIAENCAAANINNAMREQMAQVKEYVADNGGGLSTAGSSNAYTVTTNATVAAYADNYKIAVQANHTNTGAATLNVNSLGAKAIKKYTSSGIADVASGDIQSGASYILTYDGTNGYFVLFGSTPTDSVGISNVVEDTTPQLGGMLDVNGQAIGDGTRELLTFTEDASAVNHVNIENEATGSGPIISAVGDDANIDLNLGAKGTGQIKPSSDINMNSMSDMWSKGADVASAAELLVLTDGNSFDVTGTTTITSIEHTADAFGIGSIIMLQFDGALTLTHHATDLILPGAANITTAAGDTALFQKYASGDWRCISYQVAASAPGGGGGAIAHLASIDLAGESTYEFTAFDSSTYDSYMIILSNVTPGTDNRIFQMRTSTDGGSTYDSGASDYVYSLDAGGNVSNASSSNMPVAGTNALGAAAGEYGYSGVVNLHAPHLAVDTYVTFSGGYINSSASYRFVIGTARRDSAADVDGVQFLFNSGTLGSGTINVYGLKNA